MVIQSDYGFQRKRPEVDFEAIHARDGFPGLGSGSVNSLELLRFSAFLTLLRVDTDASQT
jgi:hypothetical protein